MLAATKFKVTWRPVGARNGEQKKGAEKKVFLSKTHVSGHGHQRYLFQVLIHCLEQERDLTAK